MDVLLTNLAYDIAIGEISFSEELIAAFREECDLIPK